MKKLINFTVVLLALLSVFSITACATQTTDEYKRIYDEVDSSTRDLLEESGVDSVNFDDLFNLSPKKIISLLIDIISGKLSEPLKIAGIILSLIVFSSIYRSTSGQKLVNDSVFSMAESVLIIITLIIPLSQAVVVSSSAIKLSSDFMLLYIPVFTGFISASGQPLSAFTYSGLLIAFAEICQKLAQNYFVPVMSILTTINITTLVNKEAYISDVTKIIKKVIVIAFTVLSNVFIGLLLLKGNLALATDSVAVKGVKLLSGSVIPFVGGAVGDAYTSVLGTFSLIKSTVGVFGIIVILLIILPPLLQNLIWYFVLAFCSLVSSVTGNDATKSIFENLMSCISIINVITLFSGIVFIVSTGIMLSFRG